MSPASLGRTRLNSCDGRREDFSERHSPTAKYAEVGRRDTAGEVPYERSARRTPGLEATRNMSLDPQTHTPHVRGVTRIAVEDLDERREIVKGRRSIVIGLGLPLECPVEIVRPCVDVYEAVRGNVACSNQARELFENVAHLVARATPSVVVAEHAQIEWRAARHRDGSLANLDGFAQPRLQRTAHA